MQGNRKENRLGWEKALDHNAHRIPVKGKDGGSRTRQRVSVYDPQPQREPRSKDFPLEESGIGLKWPGSSTPHVHGRGLKAEGHPEGTNSWRLSRD